LCFSFVGLQRKIKREMITFTNRAAAVVKPVFDLRVAGFRRRIEQHTPMAGTFAHAAKLTVASDTLTGIRELAFRGTLPK
jgi:hypothetical protein